MNKNTALKNFEKEVINKYQIYNSIFITLPFGDVEEIGVLLPLLQKECIEGYKNEWSPTQIVESFFKKNEEFRKESDQIDFLFRTIQFIERQIVLFDALEDAAFQDTHDINGPGTINFLAGEARSSGLLKEVESKFYDFKVRVVLTAHPTQFYPDDVLAIITDLTKAIENNDLQDINLLLQQLGKTPFFKKKKPTPFNEALTLIWFLENVFYPSISNIYDKVKQEVFSGGAFHGTLVDLGFWPGGDRDGNPFVNANTTISVAKELRLALFRAYYGDIRMINRRLTFKGVEDKIKDLKKNIYKLAYKDAPSATYPKEKFYEDLQNIRNYIIENHNGLYLDLIDRFIAKFNIFGYHFATLDIRQDSRIHTHVLENIIKVDIEKLGLHLLPENYTSLEDDEKIKLLTELEAELNPADFTDDITRDTLESIYAIKEVQKENGEKGAHRYIISNCRGPLNVMEVMALFKLCGWKMHEFDIDIIPLFETVEDLEKAPNSMVTLYNHPVYSKHLERRNRQQTIMLGFSDGTKDGGYLMANWGIYKAKENLTAVSREHEIKVIFFDGRGGPPARGGGKTHKFYSSMGNHIENQEIQLTVQGQTISSNFGTVPSSQYNLEQLLGAGINNAVFTGDKNTLNEQQESLLQELAYISYEEYKKFKADPHFLPYLEHMSTLKYYGKTNIGSRPSKRGKSDTLKFEDLRAIPFVGSWSQLKQNVPGYFGVGTALKAMQDAGRFDEVQQLYDDSLFFRTLLENSMMSLTKSYFPLTKYMSNDPVYGSFWNWIYNEYKTTVEMLELISGGPLMANEPEGKSSIQKREEIVLPLITIQQYALRKVMELEATKANPEILEVYQKMVTRSLYGNINASRNSA